MTRFVGLVGCVLAVALAGCGGDGDGSGGSAQRFSCDIGADTAAHVCLEFSWTGPVTAADAYKGACNSAGSGATTVSSCPTSSRVGGCKYVTTGGSVTVTWTNWYYFGTAAQDMAGCVSAGGLTATWVNP